jgi:hypothetical protein
MFCFRGNWSQFKKWLLFLSILCTFSTVSEITIIINKTLNTISIQLLTEFLHYYQLQTIRWLPLMSSFSTGKRTNLRPGLSNTFLNKTRLFNANTGEHPVESNKKFEVLMQQSYVLYLNSLKADQQLRGLRRCDRPIPRPSNPTKCLHVTKIPKPENGRPGTAFVRRTVSY